MFANRYCPKSNKKSSKQSKACCKSCFLPITRIILWRPCMPFLALKSFGIVFFDHVSRIIISDRDIFRQKYLRKLDVKSIFQMSSLKIQKTLIFNTKGLCFGIPGLGIDPSPSAQAVPPTVLGRAALPALQRFQSAQARSGQKTQQPSCPIFSPAQNPQNVDAHQWRKRWAGGGAKNGGRGRKAQTEGVVWVSEK